MKYVKWFLPFLLLTCVSKSKNNSQSKLIPLTNTKALIESLDVNSTFSLDLKVLQKKGSIPSDIVNYAKKIHTSFNVANSVGYISDIKSRKVLFQFPVESSSGHVLDFEKISAPELVSGVILQVNDFRFYEAHEVQVVQLTRNNVEAQFWLKSKDDNREEVGVKLAISLNRLENHNLQDPKFIVRYVEDGVKENVGYFGNGLSSMNVLPISNPNKSPIVRHNINDSRKIEFLLVNFPQYLQVDAIKAVESWNHAFKNEVVEAKIIEEKDIKNFGVNQNIIYWINRGAETFAGVLTSTQSLPNGEIYGSTILITEGNDEVIRGEAIFRANMEEHLDNLSVKAAGVNLERKEDCHFKDVPLLKGKFSDVDEMMKGYYLRTLAHEVGHALGLTHNFMASYVKQGEAIKSVMDYQPIQQRFHPYQSIGSYDIDAIQWGYFGVKMPLDTLFCGDYINMDDWRCGTGDYGDPVESLIEDIKYMKTFFQKNIIKLANRSLVESAANRFFGYVNRYYKLNKNSQIPTEQKKRLENLAKPLFESIWRLQLAGDYKENFEKVKTHILERTEFTSPEFGELIKVIESENPLSSIEECYANFNNINEQMKSLYFYTEFLTSCKIFDESKVPFEGHYYWIGKMECETNLQYADENLALMKSKIPLGLEEYFSDFIKTGEKISLRVSVSSSVCQ